MRVARSYASLYQHPPGGKRTSEEDQAFKRALKVMADVYASAVGTTVLQIKEIPPRPAEFDGALCLFGLEDGKDEAAIRAAFGRFGTIVGVDFRSTMAVVRFATHDASMLRSKPSRLARPRACARGSTRSITHARTTGVAATPMGAMTTTGVAGACLRAR